LSVEWPAKEQNDLVYSTTAGWNFGQVFGLKCIKGLEDHESNVGAIASDIRTPCVLLAHGRIHVAYHSLAETHSFE
jgi:hypothetical protein